MVSSSFFKDAVIALSIFAVLSRASPFALQALTLPDSRVCNCTGTRDEGADGIGYVCGDRRLGPVKLPDERPLLGVIHHYKRFGHLSPGEFLAKWWNATANEGKGSWRWPEKDGYLLDRNNSAIKGQTVLRKGTIVDRFGSENGVFVSVAESSFTQRSIPPSSLNNGSDPDLYPSGYHIYRVKQDLVVGSGPIAPWFEQPGLGAQIFLGPPLVNHTWELVNDGRLERLNRSDFELELAKQGLCG